MFLITLTILKCLILNIVSMKTGVIIFLVAMVHDPKAAYVLGFFYEMPLVLHLVSDRSFSTVYFAICCVVVRRRCHRIVSPALQTDKISGDGTWISARMEHESVF